MEQKLFQKIKNFCEILALELCLFLGDFRLARYIIWIFALCRVNSDWADACITWHPRAGGQGEQSLQALYAIFLEFRLFILDDARASFSRKHKELGIPS